MLLKGFSLTTWHCSDGGGRSSGRALPVPSCRRLLSRSPRWTLCWNCTRWLRLWRTQRCRQERCRSRRRKKCRGLRCRCWLLERHGFRSRLRICALWLSTVDLLDQFLEDVLLRVAWLSTGILIQLDSMNARIGDQLSAVFKLKSSESLQSWNDLHEIFSRRFATFLWVP